MHNSLALAVALLGACVSDTPSSNDDWSFDDASDGKADGASPCVVTAPPSSLHLDPFYAKYCSASGIPIIANSSVPNAALIQAQRIVVAMLAPLPDVRASLVAQHMYVPILGTSEQTTDLPEERGQPAELNTRARGLFNPAPTPNSFAAEENILCYERDGWRGENILIHEFGHGLKIAGFQSVDPTFEGRVKDAYDAAIAAGKYSGLYAGTNPEEYWAEGVQDYFNVHQTWNPNDINTKSQLAAYDSALYAILDQSLHAVHLPPVCPTPSFSSTQWYRVENIARGTGNSLDTDALHPSANVSGELWHVSSNGDGTFRLTNEYQGAGMSLDVANDGVYEPQMAATGNYSGQYWKITPITRSRYRLVPSFQPTKSLAADSSTLSLDTIADVDTQGWTIQQTQ
jgi:hypothetical protein